MAQIDDLIAHAREAWRPPKRMSLSQWADAYAYLSAESSAQEGRWRTLPYQRGILDAMTDPTIEQIVFKKSARVGYTKMLNHLVAYHIHQDPCSIMVVQPTESDAEGYSKEEIAPMVRDTPVLQKLVADAKARDSGNTILQKQFPGGVLALVGANSPRGFRRVSRRIVLFDEIDGYPPSAGAEGDQIKLGIRRTEYFWNRKIVAGSTPTIKGVSRVARMFEETDQRRFFVPCPHCGGMQHLEWGVGKPYGLKWPAGKPLEAYYECQNCHRHIMHAQKYEMLDRGEWRATAQAVRPGLVGFHLWAAYSYSPNATWGQLALEYEGCAGNTEAEKTFVNTVLGEVWEPRGETVSHTALYNRVQASEDDYDGRVVLPEGALVVVNGVDVQPDRLELETLSYGIGHESWSIDYRVFWGDPDGQLVWQQLDNYLETTFMHTSGAQLKAARTFIDTAGSNTQAVYAYCGARAHMGVYGIKGRGGDGVPAVGTPTRNNLGKIPLVPLGTFTLKDAVYGALGITTPGPGYCHFPRRYGEAYYKGLTSEEVRSKVDSKGFVVREWYKTHERNEPLDCRAYAHAAMLSLQLNMEQLAAMLSGQVLPTAERRVRAEMAPQ